MAYCRIVFAVESSKRTPTLEAFQKTRGASLGAYRVFARLGHDETGDTVLATTEGIAGVHTLCLLHCLHASLAENAHVVAALLEQARVAVRLQHPNVIHTYGAGECEGTYFVATEYLEGQPLTEIGRRRDGAGASLPEALWLRVVSDALAGLEYAHCLTDYDGRPLGVVHRNVRPENVFVTYDGHVKVLDFALVTGSARKMPARADPGSTTYLAPEQILSERTVDRRADIFAAGVVLWELLTGRRMFQGDVRAVLAALLGAPIPRVSSVHPRVDPRLDAIVARALEKDPDGRYASAGEMRDDIEAYLRATAAIFNPSDVEDCLRPLFSGERDAHAEELRTLMRNLDSAAMPRAAELEPGGFGATEAKSHPRLRDDSSSPATSSPSSASGLRLSPTFALAADLAELASPSAKRAVQGRLVAAKLSAWWVLAALVGAIAAIIAWLR